MQVFKAYFKIIRKNLPAMSIYMIVFLFFVFLLTMFVSPAATGDFTATRIRIAVVQEDGSNILSRDFAEYLGSKAIVSELPNDQESLQDALFFRQVEYILRIPAGFGQSILDGNYDVELVKSAVPGSQSGVQVDLLVDRYINTAALYVDSVPGLATETLIGHVRADLAQEAAVEMETAAPVANVNRTTYFFSYLAYTLMAVMVLGVTSIMLSFNNRDLQKRNFSSPVKSVNFNLQLFLGNLVFAIVTWALMVTLSLVLGHDSNSSTTMLLLCLNALAFTLACLCISFLIGNLIKSRNVQQSVANVLALGTCFISGVFVPQDMLGPTVLTIASFTPTYWYIRNILDLNGAVDLDRKSVV